MPLINKLNLLNNASETNKNNRFVLALFIITILFQDTGLKFIWSLESIARIVNILVLVLLLVYAIKVISTYNYPKKIWYYYLFPGILIFSGMFLNISLNVLSNLKLVSFFGLTIPWLTYLIIPVLIKKKSINSKTLWLYYYYVMLWANILGILDYVLMSYGLSNLRVLATPNGVFLGGYFSLLHMLEDGTAHYRYYACFMEPGSLAMMLLPAITYAFFNKKYVGLIIFLTAFFLTDSLGGIIGLIMLAAIISFVLFNRRKKYLVYAILALFTIVLLLWINLGDSIIKQYEEKDSSATIREENFTKTITNLPVLIIDHPLGLKLATETESFEKNKIYVGSNFAPATYLQYGGIIASVGYLICILVSLTVSLKSIVRYDLSMEEKAVFSSIIVLFPFIFQRTTIWESALFALLFAPSILKVIGNESGI